MMDIIEKLLDGLPSSVSVQGGVFELKLIVCGIVDTRLVYDILYFDEKSPHYKTWKVYGSWNNPFAGGDLQRFLFSRGKIEDQWDLAAAISDAEGFLYEFVPGAMIGGEIGPR